MSEVEVLICTTCRTAGTTATTETTGKTSEPDGVALARALGPVLPQGIVLREVECLSNCSRGCTIALRGPGRWIYMYGHLDPVQHRDAVIEGALKYRDYPDGLVPWRERPEVFRKNCIARIPPPDPTVPAHPTRSSAPARFPDA